MVDTMNMIGRILYRLFLVFLMFLYLLAQEERNRKPRPLDPSVELLLKNGSANAVDENEEDEDEVDIFNVRRDR